jgi:hypothetical protein
MEILRKKMSRYKLLILMCILVLTATTAETRTGRSQLDFSGVESRIASLDQRDIDDYAALQKELDSMPIFLEPEYSRLKLYGQLLTLTTGLLFGVTLVFIGKRRDRVLNSKV